MLDESRAVNPRPRFLPTKAANALYWIARPVYVAWKGLFHKNSYYLRDLMPVASYGSISAIVNCTRNKENET